MQIIPYIIFNGTCEEALNFYANALNGKIEHISRYGDAPGEGMGAAADKIMHATLSVDGSPLLMASDDGRPDAAAQNGPDKVHLSLDFDDAGKQQNVFDALGAGAKISMPLQDTFWGARFGMLTDKYGVNWMFNHDKGRS